ncbi:hypothetical protein I3760_16G111200 [Carya illinoinensis]|nr:hypothetical protein I3760_16G111200 [Carya illinoinensis]
MILNLFPNDLSLHIVILKSTSFFPLKFDGRDEP